MLGLRHYLPDLSSNRCVANLECLHEKEIGLLVQDIDLRPELMKELPAQPLFQFGNNWNDYVLNALNDDKLQQAKLALANLLGTDDLSGQIFVDVGCGSGLHTVAAVLLNARQVYAIDVDPVCIAVTGKTVKRFLPQSDNIIVQQGSALDVKSLGNLPKADIVYAWGVLHHTGQMYKAIEAVATLVKPGGLYVLSIYNKHFTSPLWRYIKKFYNLNPRAIQHLMYWLFYGLIYLAKLAVTRHNPLKKPRGMDFGYDVIDWIGGYPYEYATIGEITDFVGKLGFRLVNMIPVETGTACNEYVFAKEQDARR